MDHELAMATNNELLEELARRYATLIVFGNRATSSRPGGFGSSIWGLTIETNLSEFRNGAIVPRRGDRCLFSFPGKTT